MIRPKRQQLVAAILVGGCLGAAIAGCGGGDSSRATTGQRSTSTAPPRFKGSANSEVCQLITAIEADSNNSDTDPASTRDFYRRLFELRGQLVSAAPAEVKADMEVFIDGYHQIDKALAAVDYDRSKVAPEKLAIMNDPKFEAAISRVGAYATQVCMPSTTTSAPVGAGSASTTPPAQN